MELDLSICKKMYMKERGVIRGEKGEGLAPGGVVVNLNRKEDHFGPYRRKPN